MQVIEQWSGHIVERRAQKPSRVAGHGRRYCKIALKGKCTCGAHGRKWLSVPYQDRVWMDMFWGKTGNGFFSIMTARERADYSRFNEWYVHNVGKAIKWRKKYARRMINKFHDRDGSMEYC